MATLTPHDEYILRTYGASDADINAYKYGTANAAVTQRINDILQSVKGSPTSDDERTRDLPDFMKLLTPGSLQSIQRRTASNQEPPFGGQYPWNTGGVQQNTKDNNFTDLAGGLPQAAPKFVPSGSPKQITPGVVNNSSWYRPPPNPGLKQIVYTDQEQANNDIALDRRPPAAAPTGAGTDPGAPPDPGAYPTYPNLPPLSIPDIIAGDFTPQATEQINGAYAPLYQMVDQAKTNTQQQGDRSTTQVSGAFEKAINDIANAATQTGQRNDQAIADTGQQGQQVGQTLANDFSANNNSIAQTLAQQGQGAATPDILQQGANDAGWFQGQSQLATQAMQQYLEKQKLADANYATDTANTTRGQGANAVSNIANNVAQQLFGLDQNKLGYQSDAANAIIQLAQQMQNTDIGVQSTNASNTAQEGLQQIENLRNQYGASTGEWDAREKALEAYKDRLIAQQNADTNSNAAQASAAADLAKLQAGGTGSGTGGPNQTALADLFNTYKADPQSLAALQDVYKLSDEWGNSDYATGPKDIGQAKQKARALAIASGADEDFYAYLAGQLWNVLFGTKATVGAGAGG